MGDAMNVFRLNRRVAWIGPTVAVVVLAACSRGGAAGGDVSAKAGADGGADASGATPVTMGQVTRATLAVTVTGTGETDAVQDERVRAPFNGRLVTLVPNLGEHVRQGEVIGEIVSQTSEAALEGARSMMRTARNAGERADAARALAMAEHDLVRTPLRAPRDGVVIARPASPGELLAEGDSVVSIAATGSMVFFADVAQADLVRVHAGEPALIQLTSRPQPIRGIVHAILPADTGFTANMRVRIDLIPAGIPVTVGLYGTASIIVAEHDNTVVVPKPALLRDDITGITKIALVNQQNEAQWIVVRPGLTDSTWAEIVSPALRIGQRVITTGQVGLPDSTKVVAMEPADTSGSPAGADGGAAQGTHAQPTQPQGGGTPGAVGAAGGGGTAPNVTSLTGAAARVPTAPPGTGARPGSATSAYGRARGAATTPANGAPSGNPAPRAPAPRAPGGGKAPGGPNAPSGAGPGHSGP